MRRDDIAVGIPFAAPTSGLETALCQAMAEALELDAVGVDDDFFALGGDSQAAEVLFLSIEERTGDRLPLATLYQRPTPRGLATLLSSGADRHSRSAVAALRKAGDKAPLFIVPGLGGEAIGMEPLVRHLKPDRPVYCCQFADSEDADAPPASIEAMSERFLAHILRLQPAGPYHLLGACFGGLVALQLAQRLRAEHRTVGLLCLCDTPYPAAGLRPHLPSTIGLLADRARHFGRELGSHRAENRMAYLRRKMRRLLSVVRNGKLPLEVQLELAKRRLVESNRTATRRYVVQQYAGRAVYVRSGERAASGSQARRDRWRSIFSDGLAVHTIACRDSGELFRAHAEELAVIVSSALGATESPAAPG